MAAIIVSSGRKLSSVHRIRRLLGREVGGDGLDPAEGRVLPTAKNWTDETIVQHSGLDQRTLDATGKHCASHRVRINACPALRNGVFAFNDVRPGR